MYEAKEHENTNPKDILFETKRDRKKLIKGKVWINEQCQLLGTQDNS